MLIRIVKMEFNHSEIERFKSIFKKVHTEIRSFEGCQKVVLYQDKTTANICFTYSHWDNAKALENYRQSDFFKVTWSQTKALFCNKPMAWSVGEVN